MSTEEALMTIKTVAMRTGLSAHVIRVWERRYRAIVPERTATRRRLYSAEMVERLGLLARLTKDGRNIGTIAALPTAVLRGLLAEPEGGGTVPAGQSSTELGLLEQGLAAVRGLDAVSLEAVLRRAELTLGFQGMVQRMAAPLCQALGEQWRQGLLSAAHEHLASAVLQSFLLRASRLQPSAAFAPVLVLATPMGQVHELGALLACATAANLGWRVVYLGGNLPAAEIAGAVRQHQARALALSLVYPEDDPSLAGELLRLRSELPPSCALIVGGRAADSYQEVLRRVEARVCVDLVHLGVALDALRRERAAP
jgi:DNA-binding transcriptional MerR regulator/methylmalonyl-CoA mutase cobalamin-binding subunit